MELQEKLSKKILNISTRPSKRGMYTIDDALEKGLGLATSKVRDIKLYLLVDIETDTVYDVKFFSYGKKVSVAIAETLCSLLNKKQIQAMREILPSTVENALRDDPSQPCVDESEMEKFDIVSEIIRIIISEYNMVKSKTLALREEQKQQMVDREAQDKVWYDLPEEEKMARIEACLDEKIRPGLAMDGGGAVVDELKDGKNLIITYQGNCGGCGSSISGTLFFIEDTLRKNVFHNISVQPTNA